MRFKSVLVLIMLVVLCAPALGQTTAQEWLDKGNVLYNQSMYYEAVPAYNKSLELDPNLADAWSGKGVALNKLAKYDRD